MERNVYVLELTYEYRNEETVRNIRAIEGVYKTRDLAESREDYLLRKGTYGGCFILFTKVNDWELIEDNYWKK